MEVNLDEAKARDAAPKREIKFGLMKGELGVTPDFDDPLPDDLLDLFENGPIEPPPDAT